MSVFQRIVHAEWIKKKKNHQQQVRLLVQFSQIGIEDEFGPDGVILRI